MAGSICGRSTPEASEHPRIQGTIEGAVRYWRKTIGCVLSPRDAFELVSELATLELRIRTANANARQLAHFLSDCRKISHVRYPGLKEHPNSDAVSANFCSDFGHGSIVTIKLETEEAMHTLIDALESYDINCRLTLGDLATTVLPIRSVFGTIGSEIGTERFGNYEGLLRISIGIEPFEHLRKAFEDGLSKI